MYPLTAAQIRARWMIIVKVLGLEHLGVQVRSLRGGGTVWLYEQTQNIFFVYWRGRWIKEKSLQFYLQDALTRRSLGGLPDKTKQLLLLLERMYPSMRRCY